MQKHNIYDIYNPIKNLKIGQRLPGLQNILRAKMMAMHHTLQLLTTTDDDDRNSGPF